MYQKALEDISDRALSSSDLIVIRVLKQLKKRMKNARINWCEEIRAFIERRLRSYELYNMLKTIKEGSRKRKVFTDSSKLIREDRELR